MDDVLLDAEHGTVAFRRPGLSLHLNCIGKGYALDRMAELLDADAVGDYLLHGGRSSVLRGGIVPVARAPDGRSASRIRCGRASGLRKSIWWIRRWAHQDRERNSSSTQGAVTGTCSIRGQAGRRRAFTRQRSSRRRPPRLTRCRPRSM